MKKHFFMDCSTAMDFVHEADKENSLSLLTQLRIEMHLLFCAACTGELKDLRRIDEIMKADFFPPSPDLGDIIMERLHEETAMDAVTDAPAGFSFRGWVIIGFFVLLSLSSAFFGMNFVHIADAEGSSFLLPLGITVGVVLTCYGAFFIGSHLKALSSRFGLR